MVEAAPRGPLLLAGRPAPCCHSDGPHEEMASRKCAIAAGLYAFYAPILAVDSSPPNSSRLLESERLFVLPAEPCYRVSCCRNALHYPRVLQARSPSRGTIHAGPSAERGSPGR